MSLLPQLAASNAITVMTVARVNSEVFKIDLNNDKGRKTAVAKTEEGRSNAIELK
jgi:hypothetical protein